MKRTTIVLLSMSLFLAIVGIVMAYPYVTGTRDVNRDLYFPSDGSYDHYYVYRENTSQPGYINISYTSNSSIVYINSTNVRKVDVDMPSLFENHSSEIWWESLNFTTMQSWFINNDPYKAVIRGEDLEEFVLRDVGLEPKRVTVNGTSVDFTYEDEDVVLNLSGIDMSNKEIVVYFRDSEYWISVLGQIMISILLIFLTIKAINWTLWRKRGDET